MHLIFVDIESGNKVNVADMISTKVDMHKARNKITLGYTLIVVHPLNQRGSAIAHSYNRHVNLAQGLSLLSLIGTCSYIKTPKETAVFYQFYLRCASRTCPRRDDVLSSGATA